MMRMRGPRTVKDTIRKRPRREKPITEYLGSSSEWPSSNNSTRRGSSNTLFASTNATSCLLALILAFLSLHIEICILHKGTSPGKGGFCPTGSGTEHKRHKRE